MKMKDTGGCSNGIPRISYRTALAANRELIARFKNKIQVTLARIWGEEEPATMEA